MLLQVSKWGNSLAIRLPQLITKQLQISEGTRISISVQNDLITARPLSLKERAKQIDIEELSRKITEKNKPVFT